MQCSPAFFSGFLFDGGADGGVGGGHIVQPVEQRFEIQHRSAHQQRQFAPRGDVMDKRGGIAHKFGGAVGVERVADVD